MFAETGKSSKTTTESASSTSSFFSGLVAGTLLVGFASALMTYKHSQTQPEIVPATGTRQSIPSLNSRSPKLLATHRAFSLEAFVYLKLQNRKQLRFFLHCYNRWSHPKYLWRGFASREREPTGSLEGTGLYVLVLAACLSLFSSSLLPL
jgi:hypothetical protein